MAPSFALLAGFLISTPGKEPRAPGVLEIGEGCTEGECRDGLVCLEQRIFYTAPDVSPTKLYARLFSCERTCISSKECTWPLACYTIDSCFGEPDAFFVGAQTFCRPDLEVGKKLPNQELKRLREKCSAPDFDACLMAAERLLSGRLGYRDPRSAWFGFADACLRGEERACEVAKNGTKISPRVGASAAEPPSGNRLVIGPNSEGPSSLPAGAPGKLEIGELCTITDQCRAGLVCHAQQMSGLAPDGASPSVLEARLLSCERLCPFGECNPPYLCYTPFANTWGEQSGTFGSDHVFCLPDPARREAFRDVEPLEKKCATPDFDACLSVAEHLLSGELGFRDPRRAWFGFASACYRGEKRACEAARNGLRNLPRLRHKSPPL
jgi:hypothetical protein